MNGRGLLSGFCANKTRKALLVYLKNKILVVDELKAMKGSSYLRHILE